MLSDRYPPDVLSKSLLGREDYHPYPTAHEREPWESLPPVVQAAHIERGERAVAEEYPPTPATVFLDFARNGNRSRYQDLCGKRRNMLGDLVLAECVEGSGHFLDPMADGIWCICEETYWGVPAHVGVQQAGVDLPDVAEPTVDLFAAETAALLAWTYYLIGDDLDTVSKLIRPRIEYEIERRILTPCLERDDFGWMGLQEGARVNNWNPWICSNWLACALLMEPDAERRLQAVNKILKCLDVFINGYPEDGGCDEGPGYWNRAGASLFDCLELLLGATDGKVDVYDESLIRNMGRFIYRAHISGSWLINFADAGARAYPSPSLVFRYGQRIRDEAMMGYGAFCADAVNVKEKGVSGNLGRALPALFTMGELVATQPRQPLPRDVWLPQTQVMVARSTEGSSDGFFLAAKGGHNDESHNHNDVGQFVVFRDGKPVLIDIGVEVYTRKTFSSERYTIWTMQSRWHNLPTVNEVMQAPGREFAARDLHYHAGSEAAHLDLDMKGAYPEEAGIASWRRSFTFLRRGDILVEDTCTLSRADNLFFSLVTPSAVIINEDGAITLRERMLPNGLPTGVATLYFGVDKLSASVEEVALSDGNLTNIWGDRLFRIELAVKAPQTEDKFSLRITA